MHAMINLKGKIKKKNILWIFSNKMFSKIHLAVASYPPHYLHLCTEGKEL